MSPLMIVTPLSSMLVLGAVARMTRCRTVVAIDGQPHQTIAQHSPSKVSAYNTLFFLVPLDLLTGIQELACTICHLCFRGTIHLCRPYFLSTVARLHGSIYLPQVTKIPLSVGGSVDSQMVHIILLFFREPHPVDKLAHGAKWMVSCE